MTAITGFLEGPEGRWTRRGLLGDNLGDDVGERSDGLSSSREFNDIDGDLRIEFCRLYEFTGTKDVVGTMMWRVNDRRLKRIIVASIVRGYYYEGRARSAYLVR